MAWKINKIRIENFKYFLNPFELKPEGKHVLMYGENYLLGGLYPVPKLSERT